MREDRRAKLAEAFGEIKALHEEITAEFPEFGNVSLAQTLEEEEKYFASAQGFYKIAVVGSYSTGKTTLLKALFFDRGLYEIDLPTAADITTQVPTIIKLIPGYTEKCHVNAEAITRPDFLAALRWTIEQMSQKIPMQKPNFQNITPAAFAQWVNEVALPVLKQPARSGTGAMQEHYIEELKEGIQIFRTLDPGYKLPAISDINTALAAIKDSKASRSLRCISISIPARNITYPIQLVDLPGMDVPNLAHRQFSYKFIAEEADAVLFLKDAQKPSFTEGEEELLTHIVAKLFDIQQKCFFIFNKWHDTDHPGAERAVREVINKYHFQNRNIFRVSALPGLMYMEEREGVDIVGKYTRSHQEWAISGYQDLKQQFGNKLLAEMGIVQLQEFLEYYCENSLPVLALKNHAETINDLVKAMSKRIEEMHIEDAAQIDPATFDNPNLAKCQAGIETFKENVNGIESRLDDFADSLEESLQKLIESAHGKVILYDQDQLEELPAGKLARLFHRIGFRRRKSPATTKKTAKELDVPGGTQTTADVVFDESAEPDLFESEQKQELIPQRPVDIMTYLMKEVFPNIDVYQRVRVISNYTAGRSKVHSHEVELAVIRDVNRALREKFLEVLVGIVAHHIEVFCRTIDNESYLDNIENILTQLNLTLYVQPHAKFAAFMEGLKNRLNEACEVMAEMAIKKLDEVGVYNEDLNRVAALPSETQEDCRAKQDALIEYLRKNYEKHLTVAFITLRDEGWDELSEKIAKNREMLVGLLARHNVIASKIFEERQFMQRKGIPYKLALFEEIDQSLREKMAVLKDVAKEDLELKLTKRNSRVAEYQQKFQVISHRCKEMLQGSSTTA